MNKKIKHIVEKLVTMEVTRQKAIQQPWHYKDTQQRQKQSSSTDYEKASASYSLTIMEYHNHKYEMKWFCSRRMVHVASTIDWYKTTEIISHCALQSRWQHIWHNQHWEEQKHFYSIPTITSFTHRHSYRDLAVEDIRPFNIKCWGKHLTENINKQ